MSTVWTLSSGHLCPHDDPWTPGQMPGDGGSLGVFATKEALLRYVDEHPPAIIDDVGREYHADEWDPVEGRELYWYTGPTNLHGSKYIWLTGREVKVRE